MTFFCHIYIIVKFTICKLFRGEENISLQKAAVMATATVTPLQKKTLIPSAVEVLPSHFSPFFYSPVSRKMASDSRVESSLNARKKVLTLSSSYKGLLLNRLLHVA